VHTHALGGARDLHITHAHTHRDSCITHTSKNCSIYRCTATFVLWMYGKPSTTRRSVSRKKQDSNSIYKHATWFVSWPSCRCDVNKNLEMAEILEWSLPVRFACLLVKMLSKWKHDDKRKKAYGSPSFTAIFVTSGAKFWRKQNPATSLIST
jgi:hypothetical protein